METKCITFYSYKGGSGRSTTLVNSVMHLKDQLEASPESPILIVDADLESAGLTYFFNCDTKFTQWFSGTVHTGRVFDKAADAVNGVGGDIIFSTNNAEYENVYELPSSVIDKANEMFPESQVLSDIRLPRPDINILQKIMECQYNTFKKNATPPEETLEEFVDINFRVKELFLTLMEVEGEQISESDKTAKKTLLVKEFLPTRKLMDISKYFDAESGTILFLGADVGWDERIAKNSTASAIKALLRECFKKNFRAVVFDSGCGTQSTPHVLHSVSDVIIYCMRPTLQFIKGTRMQLRNYRSLIERRQDKKKGINSTQKSVILLPTAVPHNEKKTAIFYSESFESIEGITKSYSRIIDDSFCNFNNCLHEVSLFKWREHILGASIVNGDLDNSLQQGMAAYFNQDTMPEDAKEAFCLYKRLAERIQINL